MIAARLAELDRTQQAQSPDQPIPPLLQNKLEVMTAVMAVAEDTTRQVLSTTGINIDNQDKYIEVILKHIVKVFEQDQAGNESEALITVEIDRLITEIIDFSPLKVEINRRRGIIYPVYHAGISDWDAPPGSPEEITDLREGG